ncbi:DUF4845 domain-containing protein [Pseudomonas sp. TUM22785]|uniref:DUF4845 domain-containing protein n=1 Tax=Pseudomonas sp. TUM22785 TaxID=3019098 RepID=UPI002304EFE5|nr:DUF4845 domain-containing protein [Pseudomonas sp. TUM22785]WCD78932.1 DUF4845 domain-containing protein [Pseudomonas sp. TUM22785]
MTFAHSQRGLSILGWLIALAVVAFLASTAFKFIPHYMDYYALEKMIKSVENDRAQGISTPADFISHLNKGMQVNSIRDIDLSKALQVRIENNDFLVALKYEKREPLIGNLDLVVHFDKEFRVRVP